MIVKTIAVILAGGKGLRMGAALPKQFMRIADRMVIEYSLEAFDSHPLIDEIWVVGNKDYFTIFEELHSRGIFEKWVKILPGGRERHHSTLAALKCCGNMNCRLLIHDSVRPFVSHRIISDCISALDKFDAVNTVIPATDTIISVDDSGRIVGIPNRSMLRQVQTPQGFHSNVLKEAYAVASECADFVPTDDFSVVVRYAPAASLGMIDGDSKNFKITHPQDILTAESIIHNMEKH